MTRGGERVTTDAATVAHLVEIAAGALIKTCAGCGQGDPLDRSTWMHTNPHAGPGEPWLPTTYKCQAPPLVKLIDAGRELAARLGCVV